MTLNELQNGAEAKSARQWYVSCRYGLCSLNEPCASEAEARRRMESHQHGPLAIIYQSNRPSLFAA